MLYDKKVCQFCEKEFVNIEGRSFSNHVRWCDKNNTNGDKGKRNLKKAKSKYITNILGEIKEFKVLCEKCNNEIIVKEREFKFPIKEKYYCNMSCANSRGKRSEECKEKIRKKLSKPLSECIRICNYCNKKFINKLIRKYCSKQCLKNKRREHLSEYQVYKKNCQFDFNLNDFKNEYDFTLIKKYGWYKAKNRGNNLTGISRDHIISIKYGFKNNIDFNIIKHPANCSLMQQPDNAKKNIKCNLTIRELEEKIEMWNKNYDMGK